MIDEIADIANLLKDNFQQIDQIKVFAFGSATCPEVRPNDIDILIIYNDPALPPKIRKLLQGFGYVPIHLIFLTPQEEIEISFVVRQRCIPIL